MHFRGRFHACRVRLESLWGVEGDHHWSVMKSRNSESQNPLEPVDVSRRKVVKVALAASAVAVPVISSVALGGVSPAFAESPNISGQTTTTGTQKPATTANTTTTTAPDVTTDGTTTISTSGTTTAAPTTSSPPTEPTDTTSPPTMPTMPTRPTRPPTLPTNPTEGV